VCGLEDRARDLGGVKARRRSGGGGGEDGPDHDGGRRCDDGARVHAPVVDRLGRRAVLDALEQLDHGARGGGGGVGGGGGGEVGAGEVKWAQGLEACAKPEVRGACRARWSGAGEGEEERERGHRDFEVATAPHGSKVEGARSWPVARGPCLSPEESKRGTQSAFSFFPDGSVSTQQLHPRTVLEGRARELTFSSRWHRREKLARRSL